MATISCKSINFWLFSTIKLFKVGTCLNCLSLVNMIQDIKLVWKRRTSIIFHKDHTNLHKKIKLKVDVENDSYFCKKLSGADLNWSKQIRNPWEILVKFEGFSLQLYYQPNSFTGIVLVFFVLHFYETPILGNIFWWPFHFMLIVKHVDCHANL